MSKPIVLTIGGYDPSSGAGITTDLKVFQELDVYGTSALTTLTIQNSERVFDTYTPPIDILKHQLEALLQDIHPEIIKVSIIPNKESVLVIKEQLLKLKTKRLVLDPIFASTSSFPFLNASGQQVLIDNLLPQVQIFTPNISEAEKIAGFSINNAQDAQRAASIINDLGPKWVVIKGGHREIEEDIIEDLVFDGAEFYSIKKKRLDKDVRGTGCIFAAAISAFFAQNNNELEAIKMASDYVYEKIELASEIGSGRRQI